MLFSITIPFLFDCLCVHTNHVPLHPTVEQRSCQEKEEDKVLVWRDHYTAAVLQCLMNTVTVLAIPCDSGSTASLTIVAFMLFCSSLLCFLMPFSCALCTAIVSSNVLASLVPRPFERPGYEARSWLAGGWGCFNHVNMMIHDQ